MLVVSTVLAGVLSCQAASLRHVPAYKGEAPKVSLESQAFASSYSGFLQKQLGKPAQELRLTLTELTFPAVGLTLGVGSGSLSDGHTRLPRAVYLLGEGKALSCSDAVDCLKMAADRYAKTATEAAAWDLLAFAYVLKHQSAGIVLPVDATQGVESTLREHTRFARTVRIQVLQIKAVFEHRVAKDQISSWVVGKNGKDDELMRVVLERKGDVWVYDEEVLARTQAPID